MVQACRRVLFRSFGEYKCDVNKLTLCNAGHNKPLLLTENGIEVIDIESNIAVGVTSNFKYEQITIEFKPDSSLIVYTDGVSECENIDGKMYGENKIIECCSLSTINDSAMEIRERLYQSTLQFKTIADQNDDITIFVLKPVKRFTQEFENMDSISELSGFISKINLDSRSKFQVTLIIEELLANVFNYNPGYKVIVILSLNNNLLHIDIKYKGLKFDPTIPSLPDVESEAMDRKVGGLGLHLVQSMVEKFEYEIKEDFNHIQITKHIKLEK